MRRPARLLVLAALLAALVALPGRVAGHEGRLSSLRRAVAPAAAARRLPAAVATAVVVTRSSAPGGIVSRALFGANLLWPYGAGGTFDARTGRFSARFVALARSLGVSALRYPGGTTADSFHWQEAIGPLARRGENQPYGVQGSLPAHRVHDPPVRSLVGPDQFGQLLEALHAQGTLVVNFATGTAAEAAGFVAYLTARVPRRATSDSSSPGYWAERRARNGHRAPYPIAVVEVGNEQQASAEYGWRSGALVSLGPHPRGCPAAGVATCLYLFGGTTRFTSQPVGLPADERLSASLSSGRPGQLRTVYFPPVVAGSQSVRVGGVLWHRVADLALAGSSDPVYSFDPSTGTIGFGNGVHGAIPPKGAQITASYESGPHDGFVGFYRAIKRVDPRVLVCETYEDSTTVLRLLGRRFPYDCVEQHVYVAPKDTSAAMGAYEQYLMSIPAHQSVLIAAMQAAARRDSGRKVPIVVTEYGQMVAPLPRADPGFLTSLDEGLLTALQLHELIGLGVPLAEKYLLASQPFEPGAASVVEGHLGRPARGALRRSAGAGARRAVRRQARRAARTATRRAGGGARAVGVLAAAGRPVAGGPVEGGPAEGRDASAWSDVAGFVPGRVISSAMIAGPGPSAVAEPSGLALGLMSALSGGRLVTSSVIAGPTMGSGSATAPVLVVTAVATGTGYRVVVENDSPTRPARASLRIPGLVAGSRVAVSVLDGPSPLAANDPLQPRAVAVQHRVLAGSALAGWSFPAHSLTLLAVGSPGSVRGGA